MDGWKDGRWIYWMVWMDGWIDDVRIRYLDGWMLDILDGLDGWMVR